ncbi:hypothetical protein CAP36_07925 [Chitinophagaceae bacterium IBVUCB2]|nr:hypothetical protein CAP36_07925 [Chitinophagaceae bacterium IBVUCB2]
MINPYKILKVDQDAEKGEIMKAQLLAMKEKKYSLQEIAIAVRQLLDPAKRLAADYMFPAKIKAKRIQKISVEVTVDRIDLSDINENAFDSLK